MRKAIISLLMTLLVLVNRSDGVAMSRNNQLTPTVTRGLRATGENDVGTNKTLSSNSNGTLGSESADKIAEQHRIKSELEEIRAQAKSYFEDIKLSIESLGCRIGIWGLCEDDPPKTGDATNPTNSTAKPTEAPKNTTKEVPAEGTPKADAVKEDLKSAPDSSVKGVIAKLLEPEPSSSEKPGAKNETGVTPEAPPASSPIPPVSSPLPPTETSSVKPPSAP